MSEFVRTTSIASWGNSEAVRLPKNVLRKVGLRSGDPVRVKATSQGAIEIRPLATEHRRVQPMEGITYESLFDGYEGGTLASSSPWGNDDMLGAELESWSY